MSRRPVHVLWCSNQRQGASNRWSFPPAVRRHLQQLTAGKSVLQQFGGLATFGVRMDIDPTTRPHVIADAWLPPFAADSFDVVVLDPPYFHLNQQMKSQLLTSAAFVARERVIWFHTMWIAAGSGLSLRESWLVRVGDTCAVRALQVFDVTRRPKTRPRLFFTRGPAIKYNRWLMGNVPLPFGERTAS